MSLPSLSSVLAYQNPAVLKFFEQTLPGHTLEPAVAFRETLKYLWLTQKHAQDVSGASDNRRLPRNCIMLRSMQEIDDMWHAFILFTAEYADFCRRTFGRFIHHAPNIFDSVQLSSEAEQAEIARLVPYIYDHLGEQTVRIWFAPYLDVAGTA